MATSQQIAATNRVLPRAHPVSWGMLVLTTFAILAISVDASIESAVLPEITKAFGMNTQDAGFMSSIYYLGCAFGGVIFGVLSDSIGTGYRRSWTWIATMILSLIGGVLSFAFAASMVGFYLLRFVMGFARGGGEPVNVALIGEWWQKEDRGFAVGVHHTGFPFGQFIGPAIIGAILGFTSWPHVYLIVPLICVPIVIVQAFLGTRRHQQDVFDWIDAEELTRPVPEVGQRGERHSAWPLIKTVMSNPNARASMTMNFLFLFAELGVATFITLDLTNNVGLPGSQAALISGASGLTGWIGQVFWGRLSDRLGRKFAIRIIIFGWIVAALLMTLISSAWSAWVILIAWGLVRNSSYPVNYALLIDSLPEASGSAMGIMIGLTFGVAGAIVSVVGGVVSQHFGWTAHYIVLAVAVGLALIPLSRVKETVVRDTAPAT